MDYPEPTKRGYQPISPTQNCPTQNRPIEIGPCAIGIIRNHPEKFSQLLKQSAPGAPEIHKPQRVKVHLEPDQVRYFGDGSTAGAVNALLWNLITLGIGYKQCGGNFFCGEDKLDEHTTDGLLRAKHIADAGIDDFNGSDQLNWLHRLPAGDVEELISIVLELKENQSARPELDFKMTGGEEDVILYPLNLKEGTGSYAIVANAEGIWFKQTGADVENPDAVKLLSLQEYQNIETLNKIKLELTAQARIAFQPYLTLQDIGHHVDETSPVAVGDTGGSTALMVLMAIQAGKIEISDKGIRHLATTLNAEADILAQFKNAKTDDDAKLIRQRIQEIVKLFNNANHEDEVELIRDNDRKKDNAQQVLQALEASKALERCLVFKESTIPLIFSSDIASDEIRREMKKVGVIFIAGTHDLDSVGANKKAQRKVCTNAHYDESTKTLYVSSGLEVIVEGNRHYINAAFGKFPMTTDPQQLVDAMNASALPDTKSTVYSERVIRCDKFRNFSPGTGATQNVAQQMGVRIVIAGERSEHSGVIALGSLNSPDARPVLAARIGRANPTIL